MSISFHSFKQLSFALPASHARPTDTYCTAPLQIGLKRHCMIYNAKCVHMFSFWCNRSNSTEKSNVARKFLIPLYETAELPQQEVLQQRVQARRRKHSSRVQKTSKISVMVTNRTPSKYSYQVSSWAILHKYYLPCRHWREWLMVKHQASEYKHTELWTTLWFLGI